MQLQEVELGLRHLFAAPHALKRLHAQLSIAKLGGIGLHDKHIELRPEAIVIRDASNRRIFITCASDGTFRLVRNRRGCLWHARATNASQIFWILEA